MRVELVLDYKAKMAKLLVDRTPPGWNGLKFPPKEVALTSEEEEANLPKELIESLSDDELMALTWFWYDLEQDAKKEKSSGE